MLGKGRFVTTSIVALLLFPLLTVISYELGIDVAPVVSAATSCSADEQPDGLDINKVEGFSMTGDGQSGQDEDGDWEIDGGKTDDGPSKDTLERLTSSFYTSFQLENDSAVGLRMNLTTGWKYTFCIDILPLNETSDDLTVETDVYLLQEDDFSQYQWDFDSRHNDWGGLRDDIAHSAPWLQNLLLWNAFRDVHSYEKVADVEFAVGRLI